VRSTVFFLLASGALVACAAGSTPSEGDLASGGGTSTPSLDAPDRGMTGYAAPPQSPSSPKAPPAAPPAPPASSSSSGAPAGGACGLCDRDWLCGAYVDYWKTTGSACVNTVVGTTLHCNGQFDQGGYSNLGTWSGDGSGFTMYFPNVGGGTVPVDCAPAP
jgi:hypothetical protein